MNTNKEEAREQTLKWYGDVGRHTNEEQALEDVFDAGYDAALEAANGNVRKLAAEKERLEAFVNNLNSIAFEEWYGNWHPSDGQFWIYDGIGCDVASGVTVVEAIHSFWSGNKPPLEIEAIDAQTQPTAAEGAE